MHDHRAAHGGEPAREELARTLQRLTKDAVEVAAEWAGVETQLEDDTVKELEKEVLDLTRSAAASKDAVAKRQLEIAAASLREELDRLGELKNKRERILAACVAALCFLRVRGSEFGEGLLFRTASATSVGLLIATGGAAVLVYRAAGAVVAPLSVVRVVLSVAVTVAVGRWLPEHGKVFTVLCAGALALLYSALLLATRELGRKDLAMVVRVLARRKR